MFSQNINKRELKKRPKSIEEAIDQIGKVYTDSAKVNIRQFNEEYFIYISHSSIGDYIVHYWPNNFLSKSKLGLEFNKKGVEDENDMARILYRSYYRKLKALPIKLEEQIEDVITYNQNKNDSIWIVDYDKQVNQNILSYYEIGDSLLKTIGYDYNNFKKPRKTALVYSKIINKSDEKIKIEIVSIKNCDNRKMILDSMGIEDESNIWVYPFPFQKL